MKQVTIEIPDEADKELAELSKELKIPKEELVELFLGLGSKLINEKIQDGYSTVLVEGEQDENDKNTRRKRSRLYRLYRWVCNYFSRS